MAIGESSERLATNAARVLCITMQPPCTNISIPGTARAKGLTQLTPWVAVRLCPHAGVRAAGLARHAVPGFRLACLAVDRKLQGQGLGGQLPLAAGRRCLRASAEITVKPPAARRQRATTETLRQGSDQRFCMLQRRDRCRTYS